MKRKFLSILLTLAMALTLLPTAAMAEGEEVSAGEGSETPAVEYVAKVGETKYETLQEAINAAKGGSTVRLLANVTLTETAEFPAGKKVNLNLVGHNITATGTALRINGTTDIQSTDGVGTIESTGNVAVAVGNNAKVTVYSGTLKGREGAVITGKSTGATIEIRGTNAKLIATDNAVIAGNGSQRDGEPNTINIKRGTFTGSIESEGYIACGIYAPWNDNVTVSGGTFNITNGAGIVARAGTVKVTGGTFNCSGNSTGWVGDNKNQIPCAALVFDKAANYPALTDSSQILVSGGSFSTDPAANGATLAVGYVATSDENGVYGVHKSNPVAEINGVKYDTLQSAITAAQATEGGATITLLKNINTESYYKVNGDNPVTIDLAGHNITGSGISGLFYVTAKGDLTIKGEGTVTAVEDNGAAMAVWVRSPIAKVTLEGGTYTQQITNTTDPQFDLIYVERGNVYVKGGTYKGFTPDWTLNCKDEYYQSKEANIEVTGGTFVGFDPANNKAEGVNTSFLPEGYTSTKNADGTYTTKKVTYVARIGETRYETLTAAIAAAQNGETVTLLKDVTEKVSISRNLVLDLNGKTLTGEDLVNSNGKNERIALTANAGEVKVKNGIIDGRVNAYDSANLTIDADVTVKNSYNDSGYDCFGIVVWGDGTFGQPNCKTPTLNIYGKVNVAGNNGVAISTNGTDKSKPIINIYDGAEITSEKCSGIYLPSGALTVSGGTITGATGIYFKSTDMTISGGKIIGNGAKADYEFNGNGANTTGDALVIDNCNYPNGIGKVEVTGGNFASMNAKAVGSYAGNGQTEPLVGFVTGGLFSSNPNAYVPDTHHVEDSFNGSYPFAVKVGSKTDATIIVTAATNATVSETIKTEDKAEINKVINNADVDGVATAIRDDKKAAIAKAAGVTDAELAGKNVIETEITVKVEAKAADLANGKLTFEASPVATVKVNGTATGTTVPVTNAMLNGKPITVKLPLPTVDGKLFTPKQILHKFTGGGYEYFINETVGSKRGAGSFKIEGDCAVFTIYGFSTFELSGTVTYVEPSSGGGSSSSSRRYDVSAPSVKHGDVTVSPKSASKGDTVTITVKPDSGYELDTLTVKDASGSKIKVKDKGDGKFTFTMPASKVTVSAEFAEIETLDFADVSTDAYYYEAVKWAAKKGITGGTGDGTFNPNGSCTRAHIVTFLWRAAGSPEPKSTVSFADVPADSYYAKAVAWAVENGITLGTGDGTFSPNATCTRAQSVTFLYRALGTAPTTVNGFTDVTADAFYADAVAWAVESGVTNGTSASTFSPNNGCTRAQIVTFLYRTMK